MLLQFRRGSSTESMSKVLMRREARIFFPGEISGLR